MGDPELAEALAALVVVVVFQAHQAAEVLAVEVVVLVARQPWCRSSSMSHQARRTLSR